MENEIRKEITHGTNGPCISAQEGPQKMKAIKPWRTREIKDEETREMGLEKKNMLFFSQFRIKKEMEIFEVRGTVWRDLISRLQIGEKERKKLHSVKEEWSGHF